MHHRYFLTNKELNTTARLLTRFRCLFQSVIEQKVYKSTYLKMISATESETGWLSVPGKCQKLIEASKRYVFNVHYIIKYVYIIQNSG